jgi:hypothetical protein
MNKLLLTIPAIALSLGASAQLELGGKAGFNYHFQSVTAGDDAPAGSEDPKAYDGPGFHVGAFASIDLSDRLLLRPELLYSTRSSEESISSSITLAGTTTTIEADARQTLSYLELPIMLGYRLNDRFSLHAGPALGFLTGSKLTVNGTQSVTADGETITTSLDTEDTSTEGLNTLEVAGVFGLGYRLDNGLDLGLRYWRGFTTLEEEADLVKTHQNLVQVSVGYAFMR